MSQQSDVRAARAIMNGCLFTASDDVSVPFSRADLIRFAQTKTHLFHIPPGSFVDFPIQPVHREDDVAYDRDALWAKERHLGGFITIHPVHGVLFGDLPFAEQRTRAYPGLVLTSYEVACIAALGKMHGCESLFAGRVRTATELATNSHLRTGTLTITMAYSTTGRVLMSRFYSHQSAPDLGVLPGRRYALRIA
jgi:hypothetical protein